MTDMRVVALNSKEREALLALLHSYLANGPSVEGGEALNDVAEMLLKAKRADEFGGLSDA